MRNLAARSASAAKETTTLIEGSIKKTEAGTEIANKTAAALAGIVEVVEQACGSHGADRHGFQRTGYRHQPGQ